MSCEALDILRDLELLDKHDKVVNLSSIAPDELRRKLSTYRERRESSPFPKREEYSDLAVFVSSISATNTVHSLLPSCFVYNRVYAIDPLIDIARTPDQMTSAQMQYFGMKPTNSIDISNTENRLKYFELLAPLIRLGCIAILPLGSDHRAEGEPVPVFYSDDWFRSEVPEHLHDYVHRNAVIREMRPGPGGKGLEVLDRFPQNPTRGITVQFKKDDSVAGFSFYTLWKQKIIGKLDDTHYRFAQVVDWDNPPTETEFNAWVYQSVNKTIAARLSTISRDMRYAMALKSSYLTESEFEARMCAMSSDVQVMDDQKINSVNFLSANAPFLRLENPEILARFRRDNSKLFERWQQSLYAVSEELSGYSGNFEDKSKQLFEREIRPQVKEMHKALVTLTAQVGGAILVSAGAIGMAVLSAPALPFAAVLGLGAVKLAGDALPSVADYAANHKGPAYIWSKITV